MAKFGIGQAIPRAEDPRLLTGRGQYTDDVSLPGQAAGYLLRSPYAHAEVRAIDVTEASQSAGVIGIVAARLGTLPAVLAGVISGLVQAAFDTGALLHVFEATSLGLIAGFLLTQDYAGRLGKAQRQPVVALTQATQAMASGDLGVRVSIRRQGEIGALAAAFNKMAAQVAETIVTLRRFVSDAAHEIHTPLTALQTNLELAPDDEAVQRALTQVERLEALEELAPDWKVRLRTHFERRDRSRP